MPRGVDSYETLWAPANRGKVILPSLQNTEGLADDDRAAHLETGKPFAEAQYDADAAFQETGDAEAEPADHLHEPAAGGENFLLKNTVSVSKTLRPTSR